MFASALAAAAAPGSASAGLIYDNTGTAADRTITFTSLQIGNEVKAAGTDRVVTRLEIGLNGQGFRETVENLQAFLYANDAAGGAPGTQLWQSDQLFNVALTGGNDLLAFNVSNVTVPDTFTWAVHIGPSSPFATGVPGFGLPTVGMFNRAWAGAPGSWFLTTSIPFLARITAIAPGAFLNTPEPSTLAALGLGIGLALLHARRRRAAA